MAEGSGVPGVEGEEGFLGQEVFDVAVHVEVVGADVEAMSVEFGDAFEVAGVHVVIDLVGLFFAEDDNSGGVHAFGFAEPDFVVHDVGVGDVGVFVEPGVVATRGGEVDILGAEFQIGGADHDSGVGDWGFEDEHGPAFEGVGDAAAEVGGFAGCGGLTHGDHDSAVVVGVHDEEDANLPEIGLAGDGVCLGLGAFEGGEEDGDEEGDDADDDEKLDEGEGFTFLHKLPHIELN